MKPALLLFFLLTAVACTTAASDAPVQTKNSGLRFQWTAPAEARVTEWATKRGNSGKFAYTLRLSDENGDMTVAMRDFEFLEIDGEDARSPELMQAGQMAATTAAVAAPAFTIDDDGRFVSAVFSETFAADVAATLPPSMNEERRQRILRGLESPVLKKAGQTNMLNAWNAWVGYWVDRKLAPGEQLEANPQRLPSEVQRLHFARDAATGDRAKLTFIMQIALGDDWINNYVKQIAREVSGSDDADIGVTVTDATRTERVEAVVDPESLRPFDVRREIVTAFVVDGEPTSSTETRRYRFAWQ